MAEEKKDAEKRTLKSNAKSTMMKVNIDGMKSSEIHEMTAAIFKVVEEINPSCIMALLEFTGKKDENGIESWQISFRKKEHGLKTKELCKLQNMLGEQFSVDVPAIEHESTLDQINGSKEDFLKLSQRYRTHMV